MALRRSLGGIGRLYDGDALLGEVYYNIEQNQPPNQMACTVVFVGSEVELPNDNNCYRLILEDGRYLLVKLQRLRTAFRSPYVCTSCDGIFHSGLSYSLS